jgi:hypothetical protein
MDMWTRQRVSRSAGPTFRYGIPVSRSEAYEPTSDFSVALSRSLRDYMDEKDLSVERLAKGMGRSRQYVYNHTNGLRPPDTDLLNTVARMTGTDVRSLLLLLMGQMGSRSE